MARRNNRQVEASRVNDGYRTPQAGGRQATQQQMVAQYTFSGPLPPADELLRYREVVPDMPERLLASFEKQVDHRMGLERTVVEADIRRADRGLNFGFLFGVLVLVAAVFLIYTGHEGIGVTTLLAEFIGLVSILVYTNRQRREQLKRNQEGR